MSEDGKEKNDCDCIALDEDAQDSDNYGTTLQEQLEYLPFDDKFEIDPRNLKLLKILGSGHFGDVHLGLLTVNGSLLPVAVKTPKSPTSERMRRMSEVEREQEHIRQRESLRDELKIMSFLPANSNVIKLHGAITTNKDDFCVVIEYCEYGGMDSFLRGVHEKDKFINELIPKTDSEGYIISRSGYKSLAKEQEISNWTADFTARRENGLITTSDLLWFALQIARAMSFLTENLVLHRDVALRNVLLKSDFTIRVSDFGLSRRTSDDGSYIQSRSVSIPFRYIAPESLRSGRFSPESESWSFGIVLWELFSFARHQPYADTDYCNEKTVSGILDFLDSGKRLQVPDCTPKNVAKLMTELWSEDPAGRPTFRACLDSLHLELLQCNPLLLRSFEKQRNSRISFFDDEATELPIGIRHSKSFDIALSHSKNFPEVVSLQRRFRFITGLSITLLILCILLPTFMFIIMRSTNGFTSMSTTTSIAMSHRIIRNESECSVGLLGDRCLECLCIAELQGCRAVNCTEDEESLSRGIFQISLPYYHDCGKPWQLPEETVHQAWQRCSNENECAIQCIKNYVKRFAVNCQAAGLCEQISRLHHGGPSGCSPTVTDGFWKEIEMCLKKH